MIGNSRGDDYEATGILAGKEKDVWIFLVTAEVF
jgi:hypothetical protein